MAHTTSRLGLDVVDGGDNVSAYPAANAQAMGVLDNAAIFVSGTLVSRPAASIQGRYYLATDDTSSGSSIGTLYFDTGAAWVSGFNPPSCGASNIATSESRTNVAYGTLPTPDQVTGIVLPANGLISVWYQALWQESVAGAGRAAIFIGSNQLKVQQNSGAYQPGTQEACTAAATVPNGPNVNAALFTSAIGLLSANAGTSASADVTTGQVVGYASVSLSGASAGSAHFITNNGQVDLAPGAFGGPVSIFAAAGTYTVSVQFKALSGSVTASGRKLWVRAQAIPSS